MNKEDEMVDKEKEENKNDDNNRSLRLSPQKYPAK